MKKIIVYVEENANQIKLAQDLKSVKGVERIKFKFDQ